MPFAAPLLSTAFLPPVAVLARLAACRTVRIDTGEHYVRQTLRSRCCILAANGIQTLSVPVAGPGRSRCPVRDVRIAEHQPWRNRHWQALRSAYGRAPYFEHLAGDLECILRAKQAFLIDLNEALMIWMASVAGFPLQLQRTDGPREKAETGNGRFPAEKKLPGAIAAPPYLQVFADRFGFVDGLSGVDLLFNLGPRSGAYLAAFPAGLPGQEAGNGSSIQLL